MTGEPISASAIGKLSAALLPSAVGAAIALKLNTADLSISARISSFLVSLTLGYYLGSAIAEYYDIDGMRADAARLIVSLYGLSVASTVSAQMPAFVAAARRRFIGEGDPHA